MKYKEEIMRANFKMNEIEDVVHRFSPKGYELLSDTFISYLDRIRPLVSKRTKIEMMFTGCDLNEQEKEVVNRAIRIHYGLKLSYASHMLQTGLIKIGWFFLSMAVSVIFLFTTEQGSSEVWTQFSYLPIWFFGYRLLTYMILDLPEIWKEERWLQKLVSMTLIFGKETYLNQISIKKGAIEKEYFMEGNSILLECRTQVLKDLLQESGVEENELITEEFAAYLEQAIPFLKDSYRVKLTIGESDFTREEILRIKKGILSHFNLRSAETQKKIRENQRRMIGFLVGLLMTCVVLEGTCGRLGIAYHEMILISLWFFGDYLVEYILLTQRELLEEKKKWIKMREMEIDEKVES